jgi:hypothetical protein
MRYTGNLNKLIIFFTFTFCLSSVNAAPIVSFKNNKLVYTKYANRDESFVENKLIDFSWAGYKGGGVALPDVPVKESLNPVAGDNQPQIQAAIDRVSTLIPDSNGFRGAVLLGHGKYTLLSSVTIAVSGVVLRGSGQGVDGTVLLDAQTIQNDFIQIVGKNTVAVNSISRTRIADNFVASGVNQFSVKSISGYVIGDSIQVITTPNQAWIDRLGMAPFGWTAAGYRMAYERKIIAMTGNKITIDLPVVDAISTSFGGGEIVKINITNRLQNVGIEKLRLDSVFNNATDESHGWSAVKFSNAENSWVRNITATHFGFSAVNLASNANFNTVQDSAFLEPISIIDGGRRYSFNIGGGVGNLLQRNYTNGGRHDFVTGAKVAGPNVFLDSVSENSFNNIGPHHRWSTGILFDNIRGKDFSVESRKASGTGHGWSGAQVVFWNSNTQTLICDSPPGAKNFSIGNVGMKREGTWAPEEPFCWWQNLGNHVIPRSLYVQQLRERLGSTALKNILWVAQQSNDPVASANIENLVSGLLIDKI